MQLPQPLKNIPWYTFGRRESNRELEQKLSQQAQSHVLFSEKPVFGFTILATPDCSVVRLLSSLQTQSYPHWRARILMESSGGALSSGFEDPRIKMVPLDRITVHSINQAMSEMDADWVARLKDTTFLHPACLYLCTLELQDRPESDLLYTNEVLLDKNGRRIEQLYSKCDYSWFTLIHSNYIGDTFFIRKSLFLQSKGWDGLDRSCDHDFLLKFSNLSERWRLIPNFLIYLTCKGTDRIDTESVQKHLKERNFGADVSKDPVSKVQIIPHLSCPKVSAVVCFKDRIEWTKNSISQLVNHRGNCDLEILAINNGSTELSRNDVAKLLSSLPVASQIIDYPQAFNFGDMHNQLLGKNLQSYLLFLNNDVFWKSGTLDTLVAWAQFDWVGTVGIRLEYPDGTLQHGGLRAFWAGHMRIARLSNQKEEDRFSTTPHEVFANSFACCLTKRSTFERVHGLRSLDMPIGFGDVHFNLECKRLGLHNLYLGNVVGIHMESGSRRNRSYEYWEERLMEERFPKEIQAMLTRDLGYNRAPGWKMKFRKNLLELISQKIREGFPGLKESLMQMSLRA